MKKYTWIGIAYICLFVLLAFTLKSTAENIKMNRQGMTKEVNGRESVVKDKMKEVVIKGNISKDLSPFMYKTQADRYLLNMCYGNLIDTEDSESISKSITSSYDKERNITRYKITLKDNIMTSSGSAITADDVIFNYYVRCDLDYDGCGDAGSVPIIGLKQYHYGVSDASAVDKKIHKMIKKPDKKFQEQIRQNVIKKALEKQYLWVCSLYKNKKYNYITDKYSKSRDLFVYFFAYNTGYRAKGKDIDKVIDDISKQYSYKYKKLEKVTGESYGSKVKKLALSRIQSSKKFKCDVASIRGIQKYDDNTVCIDVKGKYSQKTLEKLCDIYIVPLDKWGDTGLYNGYTSFGFKRGDAGSVINKQNVSGDETGKYYKPDFNGHDDKTSSGLYNLSPIIYNLP